jgi:hypothetical protein
MEAPMRLSDDKSRELSRLVWRERLRTFAPVVLLVACGFAGLTFYFNWQRSHSDPTVGFAQVHGTVLEVKRQTLRSAAIVHVKLDDGREVDAFSGLGTLLPPGTHVDIAAATHASGKLTYDITRTTP